MRKTGKYGLYEIPASIKTRYHYRFGNHPVRRVELLRELGAVTVLMVVDDRELVKVEAAKRNRLR